MSLLKKVGFAGTLFATLGLSGIAGAHHHDEARYDPAYGAVGPRSDFDRAMAACGPDRHCQKRVKHEFKEANRRYYRY